ncbi:MAG: hypothetical protein HGA43_13210 [Nitrospirae bacterium]|nr:hypothetical protein [Nitrospirota bacterium]
MEMRSSRAGSFFADLVITTSNSGGMRSMLEEILKIFFALLPRSFDIFAFLPVFNPLLDIQFLAILFQRPAHIHDLTIGASRGTQPIYHALYDRFDEGNEFRVVKGLANIMLMHPLQNCPARLLK